MLSPKATIRVTDSRGAGGAGLSSRSNMIAARGRTSRRPSLPAAGAIVCAAVALWVSGGALTFVDPAVHTTRVGLLPPLWWLAALTAAALIAAFLFRPD